MILSWSLILSLMLIKNGNADENLSILWSIVEIPVCQESWTYSYNGADLYILIADDTAMSIEDLWVDGKSLIHTDQRS